MPEDPPKVRFTTERSPLYRAAPVGGALISVTPNGTVHVSFYQEYVEPPTVTLRDQQNRTETLSWNGEPDDNEVRLLRTIEFAAVMTARDARSLGQFLIRKAEEVEGMVSEAEGMEAKAGEVRKKG